MGYGKQLGVDVARTSSTALHEIGARYVEPNGREYRYVKAGAAIALGDALVQDAAEEAYAHAPSTAADQVISGFWPNEGGRAAITNDYFFWMLVGGDALVKAAATVVAGAPYGTTITQGTVDDVTAAAGNALAAAAGRSGIFLTTTTAGFARVEVQG